MPNPEEFFNQNLAREQQNMGKPSVCEKCGRDGVVGEDIVSAVTATARGCVWYWWVHESCAKEIHGTDTPTD